MSGQAVQADSSEREARREQRRQHLLEAAIRAIGRHGPALSMEQIAAEAGITKPILYRHFGDKRGLVIALTQRYLAELGEVLDRVDPDLDLRTRTRQQFSDGLAYLETRPGLFEFVVRQRGFEEAADPDAPQGDWIFELVRSLVVARGLDPGIARPIAGGIGGFIGSSVMTWLGDRERDPAGTPTREAISEALTDFMFDGVQRFLLGAEDEPR